MIILGVVIAVIVFIVATIKTAPLVWTGMVLNLKEEDDHGEEKQRT